MKTLNRNSILSWGAALMLLGTWNVAAADSGKGSAAPAVTCPRVPEDSWKSEAFLRAGRTLVFEDPAQFTRSEGWRGIADFSARVTFGANREGLCFLFDVKDSEVVNEKENNVDLWMQDSIELFIAAPEGRRLGNEALSFERFQLILSPPDEAGRIRSFTLYDSAYGPDIRYQAEGERTGDGYRIRLLIPYSALGDYDPAHEGLFRMQFNCNDYDHRDGSALPRRKISINRAVQASASAAEYPLFRICDRDAENPNRSLALLWNPVVPRLVEHDTADVELNFPAGLEQGELLLQDLTGRELRRQRILPGDKTLPLTGLRRLDPVGLRLVFTGYRDGKPYGTVTREFAQIAGLLNKVETIPWTELTPWRAAGYLALCSSIEFLRMTAAPGSMNGSRLADAVAECEARLAILENRPLPPNTPGQYRYLELTRNFDAQLNVAYSRGGRPSERIFTAISLPWGNIPCVNAEVYHCADVAAAEKMMREMAAYDLRLPSPEITGADEVLALHGHLLGDGLRSDLEKERQLSIYSPDRPRHVFRQTADEALAFPVEAVVVMPDTPEAMKKRVLDFAGTRNLPVIPFSDKDQYRFTLIAGTPTYPEIAYFWHSRNGLPGDFLLVRRGSEVIRCSAGELGRSFVEFLLAGRPLTAGQARRFAQLRAEAMPKPEEADRKAAPELRVGDVHTHTIFSDGQSTPAGLLAGAPMAGFDFVVISDHDEVAGAMRLLENSRRHHCGLTLFAGQEITMTPRYHVNVYPIPRRIDERFSWESIRRQAAEFGAVTQLNHPMTYGTAFADLWYGDITRSGLDAVERRVEYWNRWRNSSPSAGKVPAVTGSTDTHIGIFGYLNCTVVYAPDFSGKALASAIKAGDSAMIDPLMPELVYGNPAMVRRVAAALADPSAPSRFGARLSDALAGFEAANWLSASETVPAPYPAATVRPKETLNVEIIP